MARYVCCCYLEAAHTTDASPDIRFWSEKTRERGKETPHIHANIKLESCFARQCCNCISYVKQKMHGKQPFQPKCVERYISSANIFIHPFLVCVNVSRGATTTRTRIIIVRLSKCNIMNRRELLSSWRKVKRALVSFYFHVSSIYRHCRLN